MADEEEKGEASGSGQGDVKEPQMVRRRFVVGRTEDQMRRPGPFDDLFTGPEDENELVGSARPSKAHSQPKPQRQYQDNTAKNKAKRQRQKKQQRADLK